MGKTVGSRQNYKFCILLGPYSPTKIVFDKITKMI